jgi:hypothetical protein
VVGSLADGYFEVTQFLVRVDFLVGLLKLAAMVLVKMTFLHSSSFSASRSPMSKVLLSRLCSPREDASPMLRFESILSQSELMLLALLFNLYDRHIVILSSVSLIVNLLLFISSI